MNLPINSIFNDDDDNDDDDDDDNNNNNEEIYRQLPSNANFFINILQKGSLN